MSMLSLVNSDSISVATDQLVFTADEIGSLKTVLEKAVDIEAASTDVDVRISKAVEEAVARGEQQGLKKGRAIARRKISLALLASQREIANARASMCDTSVSLALEIVRRIGLNANKAELLVELATAAANDLEPNVKATLSVHPTQVIEVRNRLDASPSEDLDWLLDVLPDAMLNEDDCVLKTTHGSLHVGLESQLRVIERSFQ